MSFRMFRCHHCSHKMRLSGHSCGRCNEYKRRSQRMSYYLVPALVLLVGVPGYLAL